jgi:hypothetical protein
MSCTGWPTGVGGAGVAIAQPMSGVTKSMSTIGGSVRGIAAQCSPSCDR